MAKISRTANKAYFQTDDVPTEAQYIDTLDSTVNFTDDVVTTVGATGSDVLIPSEQAVREALDLKADTAKGVTNGDTHDHSGGDGAQIAHTALSSIGTNTHAQIDTAVTASTNHIADTSDPHGATLVQSTLTANVVNVGLDGLNLSDFGEDHYLKLTVAQDLTANRALSFSVNDANRIVTVAGDATISGTNTGDQDLSSYATKTGVETLTNKTLTSPKINEDVAITATSTELNYVDGVTSAIQTQLGNKAPLNSPSFTGTVIFPVAGAYFFDSAGNNTLRIHASENLTDQRVLSVDVNDANRVLTVAADATISGTNTGDQTTIAGITGTIAQFNTAVTDADLAILGANTFTGAQTFNTTAVFDAVVDNGNSGTSKTIDWTQGNKQKITTTGSCTLTFTAPPGPCNVILEIVHEASATSYTYTWPATVDWPGGTAATTTNTSGAVDLCSFYYNGSRYISQGAQNFS